MFLHSHLAQRSVDPSDRCSFLRLIFHLTFLGLVTIARDSQRLSCQHSGVNLIRCFTLRRFIPWGQGRFTWEFNWERELEIGPFRRRNPSIWSDYLAPGQNW